MNNEEPIEQQPELAEHIGATIDFDKPWRMHGDVFNAKRLPQDRNMVQCVVDVLERVGHPNPSEWTRDKDIQLAINMPPEGQIFLINRYWRLFLAEMPYDTMLQRRALMDQVASYSDYLNGFEVAVAPYVIPTTVKIINNVADIAKAVDASIESQYPATVPSPTFEPVHGATIDPDLLAASIIAKATAINLDADSFPDETVQHAFGNQITPE